MQALPPHPQMQSGQMDGVKMIGGVKREEVLPSSNIAESCDEKRSIVERACGLYAG